MQLKDDPMTLIFVVITTVGFFGLVCILAFHTVPPENKEILVGALGVLFTTFTAVSQKVLGAGPKSGGNGDDSNNSSNNSSVPLKSN